jgi:hypothetical protein
MAEFLRHEDRVPFRRLRLVPRCGLRTLQRAAQLGFKLARNQTRSVIKPYRPRPPAWHRLQVRTFGVRTATAWKIVSGALQNTLP